MRGKFLTVVMIVIGLSITASKSYAWNQPPVANLEVFREYVILGRPAILDGNDPGNPSYDPDGYITKYEWDFSYGGSFNCDYYETSSYYPDGAFDGKTTHTYPGNRTYTAALRVTDDYGDVSVVDTCYVHVGPDSDGDGLPDGWEQLYPSILNPNDANDADVDSDSGVGDGYNNLCEYLHGSDPYDGNSMPDLNFNITIYVPADVNAIPPDANSIQRAINASIDGDTIVVSEGIYYQAVDFNGVSCTLTSTDPYDWDVVANTIIDANDSDANVVTFNSSEGGNSVLTGFTVTGGARGIYCKGASPTITNCLITDNGIIEGAGMFCEHSASPTITECIFSGNTALRDGGGICDYNNSSPTVVNCVFSENYAVGDANVGARGGGICNYEGCSPTIINCTFSGNSAYDSNSNGGDGGGMWNYGTAEKRSDPMVTNCIFWGNHADGSGDEIYNWDDNSDPNFSYCDIKGCMPGGVWDPNVGDNGGGNIDSDPNFTDSDEPAGWDGVFGTYDDGLHLHADSPCIDTGDPDTDPEDVGTVDLCGNDRIADGDHDDVAVIDMGAYELQAVWFVDKDANGNDDGTSWEDAFDDLQDALANADDGDEIWVAEGTYKPTSGSNRSISFELVEGVAVYGGFAGTETGRYQRRWTLHQTILSGDIGTPDDQSDNSYHVVMGAERAVLDGFTITGGNANGWCETRAGGGMYNYCCSLTVANCVFSKNNAYNRGGGIYNFVSSPTVINCLFSGNTAGGCGGGISNQSPSGPPPDSGYPAGSPIPSNPTLVNCTFSGNSSDYGGAMSIGYNSMLINCILWGDGPSELYYTPDVGIGYCDIKGCGGSDNWDPNFGVDLGGNIDSDPCFVDINDAAGADGVFCTWDDGLRLDANSLCIDAADGYAALLEDILGLDRIDISGVDHNGTGEPNYVDIGAYESYDGVDSDGDGMPDDYELLHGLDPSDDTDANEDLDGDGLSNLLEYLIGTWASSDDTDNDGMKDGWEYKFGLDPLDDSNANEDADGDGKTNLEEYGDDGNPIIYNVVSVIVYEYDNAGGIEKETIQDGDGNNVAVIQYQYDELGRRWQERRRANVSGSDDANDIISLYSYDTRSSLKKTVRKGVGGTDPNSIQTQYDLVTENFYDSLGRITDVNDPNGGNTHYTYYLGGAPYQVTDPNGNTTTNYYDHAGRLEKVVDAEGHYRLNSYDSLGRTIKQIACDSGSNALMQTRSEYNGLGRVTRRAVMADADSTDPINTSEDMVVDYNYADSSGLLIYERKYYNSGTAATTLYGYDGLGRRTDINDPGGNLTKLFYDEAGRVIRRQQIEKDPLGSNDLTITTDYYYDSLGRLRHLVAKPENPDEEDDESWQITTYYYNVLGNRTKETKPNGVVITSSYTALGQLVEKIADEGTGKIEQKTAYGYNRLGRQTSITGYADGSTAQTTSYTYDKLDRITKVTYPDGNDIDFEYSPAGKVVKRTDQRGIITEYSYDGVYNMLAKYVDGGSETDDATETYTYDGLGRMLTATKQVSGLGTVSISEIAYNDIGKITDTNEMLFGGTRRETDYTYDQAGHPNSIQYPGSGDVSITPDWQGRIDTVKLGATTISTYKYVGSRVAQRSHPVPGITYQPSYDNLGRITSANTGTTAKFDYEYDPNTNNISRQIYDHRTNPTDPCTDFTYDNLDRLTVAEYGIDDSNEVFTIDDLGNRTNVNVRNSYDVSYSVDVNTNRYTSIFGSGKVGYWTMDDNEPNTTVVDSSSNGNDGTFNDVTGDPNTDAHDATGKIDGALTFDGSSDYINVPDDNSLDITGDITVSLWVKADSLDDWDALLMKGNWDGYGLYYNANNIYFYVKSYTYAATTSLSTGSWHHIVGTYDGSNIRIWKDGVEGTPGSSALDPNANTFPLLIGVDSTASCYFDGTIDDVMLFDKALSAEEISVLANSPDGLSYDAAGNLTKDQRGYEYEYDYENRIVKITKDPNDTVVAEFAYDALGRRIRKIDSDANETTLYCHNYSWQVLCEYNGSGVEQRLFLYGNYIDEVLFIYNFSPISYYWYVHDHLYSPAALVDWTGTVLERYEYDAYGNCYVLEPNFAPDLDGQSDYGNPYLFTGRRVDILDSGSLKIQYNRNRYYDYYTGRWLTHDPLGITPNVRKPNVFEIIKQYEDGLNLYHALDGNPVNRTDMYGLKSCDICGPDVTMNLVAVINRIVNDFKDMNDTTEDPERDRHCDALYHASTRGLAWEINQLHSKESWIKDFPCCATKPKCEGTVEVSGKCYHKSNVNYVMWGVVNDLCGNSWTKTLLAVFAHKLWKHHHLPSSETIGWAKAGFHFSSGWGWPSRLPVSRHRHCETDRCFDFHPGTAVPSFIHRWEAL